MLVCYQHSSISDQQTRGWHSDISNTPISILGQSVDLLSIALILDQEYNFALTFDYATTLDHFDHICFNSAFSYSLLSSNSHFHLFQMGEVSHHDKLATCTERVEAQ